MVQTAKNSQTTLTKTAKVKNSLKRKLYQINRETKNRPAITKMEVKMEELGWCD